MGGLRGREFAGWVWHFCDTRTRMDFIGAWSNILLEVEQLRHGQLLVKGV